eukprot:TRINITY_DN3965_c0_g1_i1.p2 TRINITY_DN3965_c0_g1~~TRINITY_DN3965_c0_g1_i1.p2  ORF type:complete len:201 (+),score=71.35 TRINITY_DN3965_c0_g1_i1:57-659(+)
MFRRAARHLAAATPARDQAPAYKAPAVAAPARKNAQQPASVFSTPLDMEIDNFEGAPLPKPAECGKRRLEAKVEEVCKSVNVFDAYDGPAVRYRATLRPLGDETDGDLAQVYFHVNGEDVPLKEGDYVNALLDGRKLVQHSPLASEACSNHAVSEKMRRNIIEAFLMSDASENMTVAERARMLRWAHDWTRDPTTAVASA